MHLQYICILIILIVLMLSSSSSITVILVLGLQFAYQPGADFDLQSTSNVSPSWTNNRLWLTPDPATTQASLLSGAGGRVMYTHPLPLYNPTTGQVVSFNTSFNFTIITVGSYGYSGDGLAFSISPVLNMSPDSLGGALGIAVEIGTNTTNSPDSHLFAVEFDTYENLFFADPSSSHIGIDFNGLNSSATFDSSDDQSDLFLYQNYTIFAWVEYVAPLHLTRVFAANSSERPSQPCVNATYDLSDLFDQNQSFYAAMSATSGASVQGTALFSWSFASEDVPSPSSPDALSPLSPHVLPPNSSPALTAALTNHHSLVLPLTLSLLGVLLLVATCGLLALLYKRKKQSPATIEMIHSTGAVPRYSYRDLKKATQGFRDTQKVGEGGFSSVYKGTFPTGDVVAVKRLKEGLRMEEEFASEIQIISRIRHRNLLQLRGWGYERGEALLVYQYLPNGSLDSYLFKGKKKGEKGMLDGGKRFSILVGVAAGLEYLHEGLGECVLHRDVKAANVLLTESFEAMLGDFGLARLITHDQVVTMTAAGTPGYVAPEVVYTGKATDKADVYSFGILALEVACGRRALDESRPPEEIRLLDWVWQLQQNGKLMDALDPVCCSQLVPINLEQQRIRATNCIDENAGQVIAEEPLIAKTPDDQEQMASDWNSLQDHKWQCVLHLALLCCTPWPEDRPTMHQVHQTLRESIVLPLPSIRPTYSRPEAAFTIPSFEFSSISSSAPSSTLDQSSSLSTAPSSLFSN